MPVTNSSSHAVAQALKRKALHVARQAPRALHRVTSSNRDFERRPPVVVNSFAKSGTHLLSQVALALPNVVDYGSFVAVAPALRFRPRAEASLVRTLEHVVPGEIVRAHLWYRPGIREKFQEMNALHLFIYRDPRDVVVSEAHYLADMAPWHRLSKHFRARSSLSERILLSISGLPAGQGGISYPNVAQRFADYLPWLSDPNTVAVRFEDLASERFELVVRRIGAAYAERNGGLRGSRAIDDFVSQAHLFVDPSKSHTYRQGAVGGWRGSFTSEHVEAMKEVAGPLLVELGYEAGPDWSS
jgi:sulfotransferase 6B1